MRNKYMYEKCEILLTGPHVEGTNKLSITHDSVKNTGPSILQKNKRKSMTCYGLHVKNFVFFLM